MLMSIKGEVSVSFVSLGCFKNLVDTEVLGGMLEKRGISLVSPYENADWIVINTCGFIRDAKEESIDEILSALEKKEKGEIKGVVVFGCLAQRYHKELIENFKNVDILWGVNDLDALADLIAAGGRIFWLVAGKVTGQTFFQQAHTDVQQPVFSGFELPAQ